MKYLFFLFLTSLIKFISLFVKRRGFLCVDNLYEPHCSCIDSFTVHKFLIQKGIKSRYLLWEGNLSFNVVKKTKGVIVLGKEYPPHISDLYFLIKTFFQLITCKYFICSFYGSLPNHYRNFIRNFPKIYLVGIGHGPVFLKELVFDYKFCQD